MMQDLYRTYRGYGNDKYLEKVLLYYPMNKESISNEWGQVTFFINDYSGKEGSSYSFFSADSKSTDPSFTTAPQSLKLDIWNDVADCHYLYADSKSIMNTVMRGDYLSKYMYNLEYVFPTSQSLESTDRILMCRDNCSCSNQQGVEGIFQISNPTGAASITINTNTAIPPKFAT